MDFQKLLRISALMVFALSTTLAFAQEKTDGDKAASKPDQEASKDTGPSEVLAGHSYHGEAFNEGPRQKAYLMGGTGHVSFPVTTKNELVQKFINQGVGQLHGFWTLEAERSFRQAAAIEPDCAMAYWGAAQATRGNSKRAKGFIAEAVKRKANVTERERMYIDSLDAYLKADSSKTAKKKERNQAYTKVLEDILAKFPDDLEAKAFLALQHYRNKSSGIPIKKYEMVDKMIKEIIAVEPLHSSHHFRIHLWDNKKPAEALSSAAVCGQGSPSIAHMWHMPGHIYSKLKRYHDAVWQQEASARVDHNHMMRDRVMPDQISNFAHNNEWLIRNMIYIGRVHDAVDLAKNMIELPRHPKYNTLTRSGSTRYGRMRLFDILNKYELWDDMVTLCNSPYLEATTNTTEQVKQMRYLGTAYFLTGDTENGNVQLADLESRLTKEKTARDKAVAAAETKAKEAKKDEKQIKKAKKDAGKPFTTKISGLDKAVNALRGYQFVAANEFVKALPLLQKASIDRSQLARMQHLAGQNDQAIKTVEAQIKSRTNQVLPLAHSVEILWNAGKQDKAKKSFEQLRGISAAIDMDMPAFARLAPIAQELKLPVDWRQVKPPAKDIGERPDLDTLGPFRWRPSPAPDWVLKDAEDKPVAFKQFQGKPVVVIFYLGYGCLHCAEQLQAFGPAVKDFDAAGISMVAISTDDHEGLKQSIENYKGGTMPIPLVADPELNVFKAYRAYDDFENQPLHGTFLIDGDGMVLWQDISYEPFMDHKFVLQEAKRLLGQKKIRALVATTSAEEN